MKKTKLLTSLAALVLVVSLGACETGDIIIEVGDVTLGDDDSDTTDTESGDLGTSGDTGGSTEGGDGSGEGGEGNTPTTNALTNYTLSITLNGVQGEQTTIPEYATAYIVGDWDNWAEFLPLTEKEDKTYEYTFSSIDVGTHEFKGVMWYSDETVGWEDCCVEIITGTGSNGNATFEVLASEGDNFTKYLAYTLTATLEEKGTGDEGNTPGGSEEDKEAELISNLIASVNQLVEECEDEDGLSVWEALHVIANDVEEDDDYISTTRTYDLGTEEDVAYGVVETYTSNDNYTTTRYYTGEGKYYEKTSGGYGTGADTGIHSTSQGSTYASIADILGYYLDYLGAIDDSGTLEDFTSADWEEYDYTGCYRYSLTDDEGGLYYYYVEEDGTFVGFFYDNGEEAYEDGWERVEFAPTTEEAVNTKLDELDYESWPVSGVQLQFTFNLDGTAQTIPEGVTLYYVEGETRTAIETSGGRYVVNPSSLEQGTHTYSIVLVAEGVEETIATGTYDISFDDSGYIKQLTVTLTQAFEDYLGPEALTYETIIAALEELEYGFDYQEFKYTSEYVDEDGDTTAYDVRAVASTNVGYASMTQYGSTLEYYSDGETTYSYDGEVAAIEEDFYDFTVYEGTAQQALMWDIEGIIEDLTYASEQGWALDEECTFDTENGIYVYAEGATYEYCSLLMAYFDDDGNFSSFDYMYSNEEGATRTVSLSNYNSNIDEPSWIELVPGDEPAGPCEEHTWTYQDSGDGYHHTQVCSICGAIGEEAIHQVATEVGDCEYCNATGLNTDGVTYEEYNEGYRVTGLDATKEAIFVPATYNELSVICVGEADTYASEASGVCVQSEDDGSVLKFVSLPTTVADIGEYAFEKCYSLEEVNIPEGCTTMWLRSFEYCTSLKSITIPSTITTWSHNYVFRYCYALESVTFLCENCTQIGGYTFSNCTSLEYIDIPEGVATLSSYAFQTCSALKRIVLPTTLTTISANCFTGCSALTDVYYRGTTSVTATGTNTYYNSATKHYYDEDGSLYAANPDGSYWYYGEDGYPTLWA